MQFHLPPQLEGPLRLQTVLQQHSSLLQYQESFLSIDMKYVDFLDLSITTTFNNVMVTIEAID